MLTPHRILVVVEKGPRNYSAYAPEVPGCVATGATRDETLRLIREALQIHLEGIVEDESDLPLSAGADDEAHFVEVEIEVPSPVLHQAV